MIPSRIVIDTTPKNLLRVESFIFVNRTQSVICRF